MSMKMLIVLLWACAATALSPAVDRRTLPPTCDSEIYCHGPLLNAVQMAGLYNDSKTFVDMKIKSSPQETMINFYIMMNRTRSNPSTYDIQEFVNFNFDKEGSEFAEHHLQDWKAEPSFVARIKDPVLQKWALELHGIWAMLARKMKDEVRNNPELYSIIYVENPVIVPGGRFREFYYWDSYWIIKGLILSDMMTTATGMVNNFLSIVERIGFIPNGGRIYYAMRSQPPLLIPMVQTLMEHGVDHHYLETHINTLDKEFDFWLNNRTVNVHYKGKNYLMAHYIDQSQGPRPESYKEDIDVAKFFDTDEKREELYAELKSAAESGWDFSTRWFVQNGTNKGNLTNLKTRSIIPVDLNAILCWNAELMAEFHRSLGNLSQAHKYERLREQFMEAVNDVLWNPDEGVWLDFNIDSGKKRDYFYPSNIAPLWTGCYDKANAQNYVPYVVNYLDKVKVDIFEGGIPTTFEHSGEQWDYPNAWPPLQYMVVEGLANSNHDQAKRLAEELAMKWVRSNFQVWKSKHAMLEKYDATIFGGVGGGGEYELQTGFGWSNGVILEMLTKYGETLTSADSFGTSETERSSAVHAAQVGAGGVATALLVVVASLAAGTLG